jgi:signal transduction histidine kinase
MSQRRSKVTTRLTDGAEIIPPSERTGVLFADGNLRIRWFTPAVAEAFGLLPQDIGQPLDCVSCRLGIDRDALLELAGRTLTACCPAEKQVCAGNGTPYLMRILPCCSEGGAMEGVVVLVAGEAGRSSQRQEADAALTIRTTQLERANGELQQFAYVASHDLREPLRTIGGFCTLLDQNYRGKLDERADRWIGFIVEGVHRMEALIDDLITYSRVHSRAKPPEPTDLNTVAEQVVRSLRSSIEASGAEVTHGELPTLSVEPTQVTQLLENLVGNAIKYRKHEAPRIHIAAERSGKEWVFSVEDNGIGIRQEFHDRVFEIFKRLHRQDEYSGTGIGLAICQKIVQRHGGRIWVESEPDEGSTFYFTIPHGP